MKTRGIVMLLLIALLLSGCWNRRELNDLAIAAGCGIDKADDGYRVSVQVIDPGEVSAKTGNGARAPVTLYKMDAPTVFEALRKMTTIASRKIYFSHLRILVIGEEVAKEGIGNIMDFFFRDHEIRTDFFIVVAKGPRTAKEALQILTPIEKIPANNLFRSLYSSAEAWAPSTTVTLDQLIWTLISPGIEPVLTGVEVKGDKKIGEARENVEKISNAGFLQYSGLAVFHKDRLIGWLDEDESKGFNFMVNNVNSTGGHFACPGGGKMVAEVIRSQTKMKGKVKNGQPQVDIVTKMEVNVAQVECDVNLTKPDTISELEKGMEKSVKAIMEKAARKAQNKYKVDIFGFGEAVHRADPVAWKTLKKNWNDHFPKCPLTSRWT